MVSFHSSRKVPIIEVKLARCMFPSCRCLFRLVCFSCRVGFVIERGNQTIRFIDINGSVLLYPNSLRSRTELESKLRAYKLSLEGTVATLRQRLAQHLEQIAQIVFTLSYLYPTPPLCCWWQSISMCGWWAKSDFSSYLGKEWSYYPRKVP